MLDGLIIGDGRVEAYSSRLAEAAGVRAALRRLIESGAPTIAGGGGLAFLTEGMRTLSGSFHPFLGVLSGRAVAVAGPLPRGHVEVELAEDGEVFYEAYAFSRPAHALSVVSYPFVRLLQKRFHWDSSRAMRKILSEAE